MQQTEKAVKRSDGSFQRGLLNQQKKDAKAAKLLEEEELRQLLGEGLMGQHGKKKVDMETTAAALGLTEVSEEVQKLLDEFSSDSSDSEEERKEKRKTIYLSSGDGDERWEKVQWQCSRISSRSRDANWLKAAFLGHSLRRARRGSKKEE